MGRGKRKSVIKQSTAFASATINSESVLYVTFQNEIPAGYTGLVIYSDGSEHWLKEGVFHRLDGPAVKNKDGEGWYKEGKPHRIGGPSFSRTSSEHVSLKMWYQEGLRHREDGPAIVWGDGSSGVGGEPEWYLNGLPLSVIEWGKQTRFSGEVDCWGGFHYWFKDGLLHRTNGPAAISDAGGKTYYLEGVLIPTEAQYKDEAAALYHSQKHYRPGKRSRTSSLAD